MVRGREDGMARGPEVLLHQRQGIGELDPDDFWSGVDRNSEG